MERAYCPEPIAGDRIALEGPEAHHLTRVRRAGIGAEVEVFDGLGGLASGRIVEVGRDRVAIAVEVRGAAPGPPLPEVTLASAFPKGDRVEWLVEKATELGVARLVPLRTARSVVDPRSAKLDRLRRRVIEACKQSGRNHLMAIEEPIGWDELIRSADDPARLVADPDGGGFEPADRAGRATIAVGPEGGLTDEELGGAADRGWRSVGLGPHVLRIETAAVAACACLMLNARGDRT